MSIPIAGAIQPSQQISQQAETKSEDPKKGIFRIVYEVIRDFIVSIFHWLKNKITQEDQQETKKQDQLDTKESITEAIEVILSEDVKSEKTKWVVNNFFILLPEETRRQAWIDLGKTQERYLSRKDLCGSSLKKQLHREFQGKALIRKGSFEVVKFVTEKLEDRLIALRANNSI